MVRDGDGTNLSVRGGVAPRQPEGAFCYTDCRLVCTDSGISPPCAYDACMSASRRKDAGFDREVAAYTLAEAARYVRLPAATLRSWVLGRQYPTAEGRGNFPPLIRPASREPAWLSFANLIEAHVLRSLRSEHGVSVKELRKALAYAEKTLGIDRLLLRPELRTEPGKVFLDRYGELIELTASGQLAMRRLFEEHLKRVEWDTTIPSPALSVRHGVCPERGTPDRHRPEDCFWAPGDAAQGHFDIHDRGTRRRGLIRRRTRCRLRSWSHGNRAGGRL